MHVDCRVGHGRAVIALQLAPFAAHATHFSLRHHDHAASHTLQVPPAGAGGSSRRGSLVALSPGMAPLAQMQPGRLSGSARRTTAGYAGRRTTAGYRRRTTTRKCALGEVNCLPRCLPVHSCTALLLKSLARLRLMAMRPSLKARLLFCIFCRGWWAPCYPPIHVCTRHPGNGAAGWAQVREPMLACCSCCACPRPAILLVAPQQASNNPATNTRPVHPSLALQSNRHARRSHCVWRRAHPASRFC